MKKGAVALLLISVLLFSIISINLGSASLLGDIWSKITGKATDNTTNGETDEVPPSILPPEPPEPLLDCQLTPDTWCPDETTLCPMKTGEDGCSVWDCDSCEAAPEPPEPPEDECTEGETTDYICDDGTKVSWCVCDNGVEICIISPENACPDEPDPDTCASQIKVTFNKNVYNIGDFFKIMIEVLDSQGNHLPNYAFYAQMYDNMWHTPGLEKTDDQGYFIHEGIAEKPAGGVTYVQFKVYTKEMSSCSSIEDTAEIKIELGDCIGGKCEYEPECKDKVQMCGGDCPPCSDDDNKEIFYSCSGCELENKCYPYGYRKEGNYCSDENEVFVNQLEGATTCENNFECKTNLCINGNCVSSNLWNKFLEWFKKLFGGGDDEKPKDCSKLLIEKDIENYEYVESAYGPNKDTQAPVFSSECQAEGTIKCCIALHDKDGEVGAGLVCPYSNRKYVENLIKCGAEGIGTDIVEYNGEEVFQTNDKMIVWTHNTYVLAIGTGPDNTGASSFPNELAEAYLRKYKSDLGDIDVEPWTGGGSFVFCTEEDERLVKECQSSGGMFQSDPNTLDGTEEGKRRCIDSKGYGEGCCEVFTGCAYNCAEIVHASDRGGCYIELAIKNNDASVCENIVYEIEHRDKCYINVAEHTGDSGICENVVDDSLREKCYFWVAGQGGNDNNCAEIVDIDLQMMCYVEVAMKKGDANICQKVTEIRIRDECYRKVAIKTNNRSICEMIIDGNSAPKNPKNECYAGTD